MRATAGRGVTQLMTWAAGASVRDLPAPIRRRAALILADNLGAMVAATSEPMVQAAQQDLLRRSCHAEATIFARGAPRGDRSAAAAVNGMAATWCELDEGFRSAPCHAGAYVIPALLAEAEASGLPLSRMLVCLALAYEITARAARAFPYPVMTVHPHAGFVTIGAAAASALVRGCDAATLLGGVTGAASMSFAGPFNHAVDGVMVRNAWTSAGAWVGMQAVDWAMRGISGIPETFYDVFVGAFGTDVAPGALTEGLGEAWAVADGYHKIFACCQYAHSAVEASLVLHQRLRSEGLDPDAIHEVVVATHPRGLLLTTVEPATDLAARFSMPHATSASAVLGTGGQAAFSAQAMADPRIANLRRRVSLVPHPNIQPSPNDRPARVLWRLRDGREWAADCSSAQGGADRPFDEATLLTKLRENTGSDFPAMADRLWEVVEGTGHDNMPWRDMVSRITAETAK
ncbi:MmgE/PrpD family protein [Humitalea sp. 24SJ18S-53]|uniref:MmgE/PrpD family protein n=1 Tax=Humitalea sp. 24SJ18S-53 TaxID=3422307 RepID=UPI003D67E14A